jgi:hypothetical protein
MATSETAGARGGRGTDIGSDTSERMGTVRAPSNSWAGAADYVRTAASQLERFANRMDERSISAAVSDLQWFARRQPTLFIGVAFGIGLIGGRFLKAAGERPMHAFPMNERRQGQTDDRPF